MPAPIPGDYITAKCRRCDDVTGHVVMLVLEGAIAKVECKACGSVHKYWGTGPTKAPKKQPTGLRLVKAGQGREAAQDLGMRAPRIGATTKPKAATTRPQAKKMESAWQEAMVRLNIHVPTPYSMQQQFSPDTLIDHPTFGRGVVLNITPPDKMDVLFQEGVKVLRCSVS